MIFVSITRLRLKSVLKLFPFLWYTFKAGKQLTKKSKFIKGKTLMDEKLTFWTMTLWNNEAEMRAYRNTDEHKKAMPKLQYWCNEASVVHWQQEGDNFPSWPEAHQRMQTEGRLSKVKHPSKDHESFKIAAPCVPSKTKQTLFPENRF